MKTYFNRRRTALLLVALTAALVLGVVAWSCLRPSPSPRFTSDQELYQSLHGKTEDEVRAILGEPETIIQVHPHAQAPFESTWRYSHSYKSSRLGREVPIHLYFHDHRVIRIDALDEGQRRIEP